MIVSMKKVSLVVLNRYKEKSLKSLRKLGLVHLETLEGSSEELSRVRALYDRLSTAKTSIHDLKLPKNYKSTGKRSAIVENLDRDAILSAYEEKGEISEGLKKALLQAEEILALQEAKKEIGEDIQLARKELDRLAAWGGVNPKDFAYLEEKGIGLTMYEIPSAALKKIPDETTILQVNADKNATRFLLLQFAGEGKAELPPEAFKIALGEESTQSLEKELAEKNKALLLIQNDLYEALQYLPNLSEEMQNLSKAIEFENIYAAMPQDEGLDAVETAVLQSENRALTWITGFIPTEDIEALRSFAQKEKIALMISDPSEEDNVPTKLKNNKVVSLIYPVTDFLGTVPGYREYDISGWFLLFFSIFFGMIFGDGGYGILIVLTGLGLILHSKIKGKKIEPMIILVALLGFSTVVWGTLTCTWFGLEVSQIPAWLVNLSWEPISNANPNEELLKQNIKIFCFALALVQLSIAHLKGVFANIKSLKFLGELGSLILLWGVFYVVLNIVVDKERFAFDAVLFGGYEAMPIVLSAIGIGFAMSFIFANYEGNIFASIMASVKDIISVLLGVVNVFSDIVSYIRLWAVALAGSAIAATINTMAGPALGSALMFLGILLLIFGHGLNMVLNVLSVLVHGVRLNTLEFTGHLGMSWSGHSYKPFSE